ncbi:MAG: cyanophycinase [Planctomycetota bacterium]|jgi:cyanophycinase
MTRRVVTGLLLLSLVAPWVCASPPDAGPVRFGTRIDVPGLPGRLVISGPGDPHVDATNAFLELAGGPDAPIAIIVAADENRHGWWTKRAGSDVTVHVVSTVAAASDPALAERLDAVGGVWLAGPTMPRLVNVVAGTPLLAGLRACFDRGGVVGATGLDATSLGERIVASADGGQTLEQGLGLLPGAVLDPLYRRAGPIGGAADLGPCFGVGLEAGAAIVVQGRRARLVGAGRATIALAAGAGRPEQRLSLRRGAMVDLITLSRRAVFRTGEVFPATEPAESEVEKGTLFIGGGGRLPRAAVTGFIEAAGGPRDARIVVIPTAIGLPGQRDVGRRDARMLRRAGAPDVRVIDIVAPGEAEAPANLDRLRDATGVWFSGGRQWRLVDAFLDTEAHELMHAVLERGGAVSGSSAGASIQAEYMVRGHPLGNQVMMAEGYERGLGFLPGAAVDQHFSQRNRFRDLEGLKRRFPQLLGLGIDEGTVLVVRGRVMEVIGDGAVMVYDTDAPSEDGAYPHRRIAAGGRYDLVERRPID